MNHQHRVAAGVVRRPVVAVVFALVISTAAVPDDSNSAFASASKPSEALRHYPDSDKRDPLIQTFLSNPSSSGSASGATGARLDVDPLAVQGQRTASRNRRGVTGDVAENAKRFSAFRSDLGKRDAVATDRELTAADDEEKRFSSFRSDLGKRVTYRSDLGKRKAGNGFYSLKIDPTGNRQKAAAESKRYSAFRSDLGKRDATDADEKVVGNKRISFFRSDLGKRSAGFAEEKRYSGFRSDLGKRRGFRSDLGKRSEVDETKRFSSFRSDLGKRRADQSPVKKLSFFRSDLGKREDDSSPIYEYLE